MYLVDFSNDYYGSKIETKTFSSDISIIDFVASKSESENFKIHRINEYKEGALKPFELELQFGRIVLVKKTVSSN